MEISKDITQVKQLSDKIHSLQQSLYRISRKGEVDKGKLYQFGDIIGKNGPFIAQNCGALPESLLS